MESTSAEVDDGQTYVNAAMARMEWIHRKHVLHPDIDVVNVSLRPGSLKLIGHLRLAMQRGQRRHGMADRIAVDAGIRSRDVAT